MPNRLLLLSNSRNAGQGFLAHAEEQIRELLGNEIKTALFIPFASVLSPYDNYASQVGLSLSNFGYEVRSLHNEADGKRAIREAEAIIVGGGNTFRLLKTLYEQDLLAAIQDRVRDSVPYIGWSAGANIACPTIRTTNDMPIVEPPSFNALNLVPFQINPHFIEFRLPGDPAETRAERLAEFIEVNPNTYVVGMRNGTMLRVEGSSIQLRGTQNVCIFVKGQKPTDYSPNSSLQFLLGEEDRELALSDSTARASTHARPKILP